MNPAYYALGTLVSEAPWFFLTTVPFWGSERIKKNWIVVFLLMFSLLRTAVGYGVAAYVPDGHFQKRRSRFPAKTASCKPSWATSPAVRRD